MSSVQPVQLALIPGPNEVIVGNFGITDAMTTTGLAQQTGSSVEHRISGHFLPRS